MALVLAAVAAFVGGGMVARLTDRPFLRGALRQLLLGAAAVAAHLPHRQPGRRRAYARSPAGSRRGYQASGPNESSPWPPGPDSSARSDSTIMVTSSSKPIFGSQPSCLTAVDGIRAQLVHLGRADERRVA